MKQFSYIKATSWFSLLLLCWAIVLGLVESSIFAYLFLIFLIIVLILAAASDR